MPSQAAYLILHFIVIGPSNEHRNGRVLYYIQYINIMRERERENDAFLSVLLRFKDVAFVLPVAEKRSTFTEGRDNERQEMKRESERPDIGETLNINVIYLKYTLLYCLYM